MGLFSKDIKSLDDLFVHQLQDIYYAEKQILKALPKMIDKATSPQLKQGLESHRKETEGHVARVEQVFQMHGHKPKTVDCPAIDGIIKEANDRTGRRRRQAGGGRGDHRRSPGRRALRDDALRHAGRLGAAARPAGLRQRAGEEPGGGEGRRPEADEACRERHQPEGRVVQQDSSAGARGQRSARPFLCPQFNL